MNIVLADLKLNNLGGSSSIWGGHAVLLRTNREEYTMYLFQVFRDVDSKIGLNSLSLNV